MNRLAELLQNKKSGFFFWLFFFLMKVNVNLRISSLVALRDLDGLPGASNFPYFFFELLSLDAIDDDKELEELLIICNENKTKIIWLCFLCMRADFRCIYLICGIKCRRRCVIDKCRGCIASCMGCT